MRSWAVFLFLSATSMFLSCSDDPTSTEGGGDDEFLFQVSVQDSSGIPMPDVRVSVWTKIPDWVGEITGVTSWGRGHVQSAQQPPPLETQLMHNNPNPYNGVTQVRFTIAEEADVQLLVSDLEGAIVDTLVNATMPAGHQSITMGAPATAPGAPWEPTGLGGSALHKLSFSVRQPETGTLLYADSLYTVFWNRDPEKAAVGHTDPTGVFQTTNRLLFPSTYDYPQLAAVNEEGVDLGLFRFADSIAIAVTSTVASASSTQVFKRIITSGENRFTIVW